MNKLSLRENCRDQDYEESFELSRRDDSILSKRKQEVNSIIVKCKSESMKNEILKIITEETKNPFEGF